MVYLCHIFCLSQSRTSISNIISHFFCIDSVCVTLLLSYSNLFLISAMMDNWQDHIGDNFQSRLTSRDWFRLNLVQISLVVPEMILGEVYDRCQVMVIYKCSYAWSFGSGKLKKQKILMHSYEMRGIYLHIAMVMTDITL